MVAPPAIDAATLKEVFTCVERVTQVDFSEYKAPTVERRVARRMALCKVTTLAEYLALLQRVPGEAAVFCEDALIKVTSFFRDPEVFESLEDEFPLGTGANTIHGTPTMPCPRVLQPGSAGGRAG